MSVTTDPPISTSAKYANYREQFGRLSRAIKSGFYLEAIFIEYSILEDRTESLLRHAGAWDALAKKSRNGQPSLDAKVNRIKKLAEEKKSPLHRRFSDDLPDRILAWKEERNRLIHALLKQSLSAESLSRLAREGEELAKKIRDRVNAYKRAVTDVDRND